MNRLYFKQSSLILPYFVYKLSIQYTNDKETSATPASTWLFVKGFYAIVNYTFKIQISKLISTTIYCCLNVMFLKNSLCFFNSRKDSITFYFKHNVFWKVPEIKLYTILSVSDKKSSE